MPAQAWIALGQANTGAYPLTIRTRRLISDRENPTEITVETPT